MAKNDIKNARNVLMARGGVKEGTPASLMRSLSFDGGWTEFLRRFPDVEKVQPGRYRVAIDTRNESSETQCQQLGVYEYAEMALRYVFGDEEQDTLADYSGAYDEHYLVMGVLAAHIDPVINTLTIPRHVSGFTIFELERGLYLDAEADKFKVYGAKVLERF